MEIIFFWIVLCIVAGAVGKKRKIGFWGSFFLSLFLSPLVGLIIAFNSDKRSEIIEISPLMRKLISDGDKLVKQNKINEAIDQYLKALAYSSKAPNTNYKLAKLFSIKKDINNSIIHISKAVQQGFKDFEKINTDKDLHFLRISEEFKNLINNGYKIEGIKSTDNNSNRIENLEKLNNLFEKGVLTKEEFELEKKKILS